ncbi:MAG: 30S ribosomal protein S3 [Parcubacteria group bacterium]
MGKKINPKVFRLKQTRTWDSRWFSVKDYKKFLEQDIKIKDYFRKKLEKSSISSINIERTAKEVNVIIYSARPGTIIGRGGAGLEAMRKDVSRSIIKNKAVKLNINIKEISNPNLDAAIIGQYIKADIEKRIPFRRAMKQALAKIEKANALGAKMEVSGRLNGAEIARSEKLLFGKVPLHTMRADIDYALEEAHTIFGKIGIKVWIYKGDVFKAKKKTVNSK